METSILSKYTQHFHPERYERPFFIQNAIQDEIKTKGYCVIDLFSADELDVLYEGYKVLKDSVKGSFGEQFWPSGRHPDPEIRKLAKAKIEEVVPTRLKELFHADTYTFIGGTYLIKPPSDHSALNPHQDSSHVDEFKHFSVYAWIPLHDVESKNGAVRVLPKSHQFNIKQRSLNVPWVLEPYIHILDEYMVNVPIRAGEVLIFDAALIHSSPPNYTDQDRVAVNYYVHPKDSPFCHYYSDLHTPEGEIEVFDVTPEFYYTEDFEQKPSSKYTQLANQPQLISRITEKELRNALAYLNGEASLNFFQTILKKIGVK